MTEGISQAQDSVQSQPVPVQPTSSEPRPAAPTPSDERTFRQSEVSDIVKRAKHDAVETFRRQQSEQPAYVQQKYGDQPSQVQQPSQPYQSANNFLHEDVKRIAAEEVQRARDQWINDANQKTQEADAQRTVQDFWSKIAPGKEKYSDFEQMVGDIDYVKFPNVVQLLAKHVENADEILYEFGKDRIKMANLEQLAERSPRDAIRQAQRLSESIKANQATAKIRSPNEPLSQMRPSNTGTDNGAMSVKDLRNKYRI